jgi:hypothetical protein
MKQNKKYLGLHNQDDSTAFAPSRFEHLSNQTYPSSHEARKFHVKQEEMEESEILLSTGSVTRLPLKSAYSLRARLLDGTSSLGSNSPCSAFLFGSGATGYALAT